MSERNKPVVKSYKLRWGHERTRVLKGHPKRKRRQERAKAREALKQAAE